MKRTLGKMIDESLKKEIINDIKNDVDIVWGLKECGSDYNEIIRNLFFDENDDVIIVTPYGNMLFDNENMEIKIGDFSIKIEAEKISILENDLNLKFTKIDEWQMLMVGGLGIHFKTIKFGRILIFIN